MEDKVEALKEAQNTEAIEKSIKTYVDELFKGYAAGSGDPLNLVGDAENTADEAVSKVKKAQDDAARGAGRPKQISDVPKKDEDGKRSGDYDATITENEGKEEEPEETKQSPSIDQTTSKKKANAKAPDMPPFKKSKEKLQDLFKSFVEFMGEDFPEPAMVTIPQAEYDKLTKSVLVESVAPFVNNLAAPAQEDLLVKSVAALTQKVDEQSLLISKFSKQPQLAKSVQNIASLEKTPELGEKTTHLSKSVVLDGIEELIKSNDLPLEAIAEYEGSGTLFDPQHQTIVNSYFANK